MNLKTLILISAIILVIIALIVFFFGKSLGIIPIECQNVDGVNYCLYCLPDGNCVVR